MKKILLIIGIIAVTVNSYAQETSEEAKFGLKAGVNNSNVYDEQGDHFVADNKIGFVGGAFFKIPINRLLGFQPEILYSQKGFVASGNYFGGTYNFTRTTTFIEIPLLLQIKASQFLSIVGGPQYCYLHSSKDEYRNNTITLVQEKEISNDNFRKNIFALTFGADLNLNQVLISGRAGWDVQNNNGDGTSSTPRYKNNWLQLTVGYVF